MEIFGKDISLKRFNCNLLNFPGEPIPPSVNLFVKVTNSCNAHCLFCSNAGVPIVPSKFNIDKLFDIIYEIKSKYIIINRINITGGEPSIVSSLVLKIVQRIIEEKHDDVHMHLNTNGLLAESQTLMRHPRWDSISMSLHHYNYHKLSELYGCNIPKQSFDFNKINKQRLNVSCNLIKGYIDSPHEAKCMLDYMIDLEIPRIGFVALMKVNDYCKEHFVDIEDIQLDTIPHVYFTMSKDRGTDCKCSNYLYNKDAKILEIYMRNYANPLFCESSLVYDGEYLRQGFHQNNVIY